VPFLAFSLLLFFMLLFAPDVALYLPALISR